MWHLRSNQRCHYPLSSHRIINTGWVISMPGINDYHAFTSTTSGRSTSGGSKRNTQTTATEDTIAGKIAFWFAIGSLVWFIIKLSVQYFAKEFDIWKPFCSSWISYPLFSASSPLALFCALGISLFSLRMKTIDWRNYYESD